MPILGVRKKILVLLTFLKSEQNMKKIATLSFPCVNITFVAFVLAI